MTIELIVNKKLHIKLQVIFYCNWFCDITFFTLASSKIKRPLNINCEDVFKINTSMVILNYTERIAGNLLHSVEVGIS